jgi:hypothetical protein
VVDAGAVDTGVVGAGILGAPPAVSGVAGVLLLGLVGVTGVGVVGCPAVVALELFPLSSPQAENRTSVAQSATARRARDWYFMIVPGVIFFRECFTARGSLQKGLLGAARGQCLAHTDAPT